MLTQLSCVKSVTQENGSSSSRLPVRYYGASFIVIFHKQYKPPVTPNIIMLICINYHIYILEYS